MSNGKSVIFCGNERVLCDTVANDSHTRTVKINGSIENRERNCPSALDYHSWHEGILGCCKMKIIFFFDGSVPSLQCEKDFGTYWKALLGMLVEPTYVTLVK